MHLLYANRVNSDKTLRFAASNLFYTVCHLGDNGS